MGFVPPAVYGKQDHATQNVIRLHADTLQVVHQFEEQSVTICDGFYKKSECYDLGINRLQNQVKWNTTEKRTEEKYRACEHTCTRVELGDEAYEAFEGVED